MGQSYEQLSLEERCTIARHRQAVKGLLFRKAHEPHILDWHRAPRRRWVITLSGTVDIGTGDGTTMTFGPGDVFLAEDVTGQGHKATPHNWVRAYVHLE